MDPFTPHGSAGSSATQAASDGSRQSAGHGPGEKPRHSHSSSSRGHSHHKGKPSHKGSSHEHAEKKDKQCHKSLSHDHAEKKDRHSHKSSDHSSGHSSSHRSSEHSSRGRSHHRSQSDKSICNHHWEKLKHSGDKHPSGSSKPQGSSDQNNSPSSSHAKTSEQISLKARLREFLDKLIIKEDKSLGYITSPDISSEEGGEAAPSTVSKPPSTKNHADHTGVKNQRNSLEPSSNKYRCIELNNKQIVIKDKSLIVAGDCGYITSPDISSDEGEAAPSVSKPPSTKSRVDHSSVQNQRNSLDSADSSSTEGKEQAADAAPVTLARHPLKPIKDRVGGSLQDRLKMLEKLKSIQQRNGVPDPGPSRKRSAWGEVKKRRAKREKLDGDFTGSSKEKIAYGEGEKPSLKRPEPRPEQGKENKRRREMRPNPAPQPPPMSFSELMKLAEQNSQTKKVVDMIPKKEKERRPLTQVELDRKKARQQRMKTQEYKDWYLNGRGGAEAKKNQTVKPDSQSGGVPRPSPNLVPANSGAKSLCLPRKGDCDPSSATKGTPASTRTSRPSEAWTSAPHSLPAPQSKPHPTRPNPHPTHPGMIANKPQAMAQHINSQRRAEAARPLVKERQTVTLSSSSSSQALSSVLQPKPSNCLLVSKTRQGSTWDNLFSRPEYKKMKETSQSKKRKRDMDSEEEDDSEDDDNDDLDGFVVSDGEDEDEWSESVHVSSTIQKMFNKHGRKRCYDTDSDSDDSNMEASFSEVMKEEARSARIGLQEDLEDIRREKEEERRKRMMKKRRL